MRYCLITFFFILAHCSHSKNEDFFSRFGNRNGQKRSAISSNPQKNIAASSISSVRTCKNVVRKLKKLSKTYRKRFPHLKMKNFDLRQVVGLHSRDCALKRKHFAQSKVNAWINKNTRQIGLILPLTGRYSELGKSVYQGINIVCERAPQTCGSELIIKDNKSTITGTLQAAAELIFEKNVSLIIGGLQDDNAQILAQHGETSMTPTILLNRSIKTSRKKAFVSQFYPLNQLLSQTLSSEVRKRKN